jgi:hypothetical protein
MYLLKPELVRNLAHPVVSSKLTIQQQIINFKALLAQIWRWTKWIFPATISKEKLRPKEGKEANKPPPILSMSNQKRYFAEISGKLGIFFWIAQALYPLWLDKFGNLGL